MRGLKFCRLINPRYVCTRSVCHGRVYNQKSTSASCNRVLKKHYFVTPVLHDVKIVETPTFPDSVTEGDIQWVKEVGDAVEEDEVIGEIETDKTTLPVQSPVAGVITELLVNDGDTISKGTQLVKIDVGGEGSKVPAAAPVAQEAPSNAAPEPETSGGGGETVTVKVPTFPDSVSEGDVAWLKEVGESVEVDEVIGEIETDKTTLPIQAPVAGVVAELLVADGSTVTKDMSVVVLSSGGGGTAPATSTASPPPSPASPHPPPASSVKPELSPTPPPIPTSPMSTTPPPKPPAAPPTHGPEKAPGLRTESRVKMSRMRMRISERLKEAQNTAAMLTTFNEIDMTNIMALRSKFKDDFLKKHSVKLGFMSAFLKASAQGLQEMPEVNAYIDGNEIVYRDYVDISVAVATPKGLVVPVLRNVETLSYAGIELGINELGKKARDGTLAIEDMDGGTFTVSNGGVFGSLYGTPIINLPQSAILGMHAIQDRPVARNGQVVIRPMMYVALTYDHRLIDGREAVIFLRRIKSAVEDPGVLLLDI